MIKLMLSSTSSSRFLMSSHFSFYTSVPCSRKHVTAFLFLKLMVRCRFIFVTENPRGLRGLFWGNLLYGRPHRKKKVHLEKAEFIYDMSSPFYRG